VLPEPAVRNELAAGTLVSLPCRALEMQRPLGVIYRRGATLGASARVFMELALSDAAAETAVVDAATENSGAVAGA
jgi:DNA-binding transcriptional LysR family regulator